MLALEFVIHFNHNIHKNEWAADAGAFLLAPKDFKTSFCYFTIFLGVYWHILSAYHLFTWV